MTSSRPGLGDRTGGGVEPERPAPDATSQRVEALAAVPLFGIIGRQQIEELAGFFVELSYQSGDTVCREGEQGDALFVVLSGELDVLGGDGRVINRLGPGEVLGEMSLLHGGTRAATVTVARSALGEPLQRHEREEQRHMRRHPERRVIGVAPPPPADDRPGLRDLNEHCRPAHGRRGSSPPR